MWEGVRCVGGSGGVWEGWRVEVVCLCVCVCNVYTLFSPSAGDLWSRAGGVCVPGGVGK